MRVTRQKLGVCAAIAAWILTGAGLAPASAASASARTGAPARAHHVSPFGVRAARSARPAPKRAGAPRAGANTTTEWVSNTAAVGGDTSCSDPGYSTISGALAAAAPGDTINVCAGSYTEQLAITQSVTLAAQGAVTVVLPASPADNLTPCDADGGAQPNQDVVDICGSGISVTITGFTIQGAWPSSVCNDSLYGVAVLGGADLNMSGSTVTDIGGDPQTDGCQGGVGIEVGLALDGTTADPGTATLTNDVVSAYQKNGITVDGAGSSATISGATVTGTGPTPSIAQNGIQISDNATGAITGSTVSGDECNDTTAGCGPNGFTDVQSCGILLFDAGKTSVSSTKVSSSDIGVYNIEDYAWDFYTPPTPFSPVKDTFSKMTLANRYENAYLDEGMSTLTSSHASGGEVGLMSAQWSGQTTRPVVSATHDAITGATQDAVLVASDQTAGDKAVKLAVTGSNFGVTNARGVDNQSTSVITATKDWWGSSSGPSDWSFGAGTAVSSDVNFFPWSTNYKHTTVEHCLSSTTSLTTTGNDVVLCAAPGKSDVRLENAGTGDVLLIANVGSDLLIGSASGKTWIIGNHSGAALMDGHGGTGFIQERGNANDVAVNDSNYTVATS